MTSFKASSVTEQNNAYTFTPKENCDVFPVVLVLFINKYLRTIHLDINFLVLWIIGLRVNSIHLPTISSGFELFSDYEKNFSLYLAKDIGITCVIYRVKNKKLGNFTNDEIFQTMFLVTCIKLHKLGVEHRIKKHEKTSIVLSRICTQSK